MTSLGLFIFENYVNVVSKREKQKKFDILKVTDENQQDPDPLVKGADPDPYQNVTDPQHWL